jgi:23S rRNA (cytosine1962-C5)-methyltransferase
MAIVHLLPDRDRSLRRHHPWIYTGAIARIEGTPTTGATIQVVDVGGKPMGSGAFSPHSQIAVRMWTFDPAEAVDEAFFRRRIARALAARAALPELAATNAYRLIHGESDGLPGLIVDRYGDYLVCQLTSAGADLHGGLFAALLQELCPEVKGIYERSDVDSREKEGLPPEMGLLAGAEPPPQIEIHEGACRFLVDVRKDQKTGFYLDQRDNRALVARYAAGREVLNCFAYTGAFGLHALAGGATAVVQLDSAARALTVARANAELSGLGERQSEYVEGNAFSILRDYRNAGRCFDLVILDPPKLAAHAGQVEQACRAYKDVNLLAFKVLRPGGLLFTFSCSGNLGADLFQKIVADAALDARRDAAIVHRLSQAGDHPVGLPFPEGGYLKGLLVRAH